VSSLSHWLDLRHPHSLLLYSSSFRQASRSQSISVTFANTNHGRDSPWKVNSDSIVTILCGNFSMPPDFGGAKHLAGSQKKCCRPRGTQDEFLAAFALKLSLLNTYTLTQHPRYFLVRLTLAWHSRDWKTHSFAVMLCQVPSPYSAFLELFRQVTPPLTQPPPAPSRRTRWPPPPCPTPLLAPYLYILEECAEAT